MIVIATIVAIAIFIAVSIAAKTFSSKKDANLIKFGIVGVYLVVFGFSSITIIDQTEVGVIRTFGEITGTIDSGLNFINPLINKVTTYDTKVRSVEMIFASYTKDAQPIDVIVEVQYDLPRDRVMTVASSFGTYEVLEAKLRNVVEERIKVVLSRQSAMSLMETRADLSSDAYIEVSNLSTDFPIHFTSVIVKDVAFSDAFEQSVEAKMTAEQAALKAEQDKKTAVIEAQRDKEVAVTSAEARAAQAELNKQTAITNAEGEAEALRILREALEAMPDTYIQQMYLEKWNGNLPQIVTGDSNLMITPNLNGQANVE